MRSGMMFPILTFALTIALGGCGPDQTGVVEDGNKRLEVNAPKKPLEIAQGEKATFSVSVKRENFNDRVKLDVKVPEGVSLLKSDLTIPEGRNTATFEIVVDKATKPREKIPVEIRASSAAVKGISDPATMLINIRKSLATERANRAAFVDKIEARLETMDNGIEDLIGKAEKTEMQKKSEKYGTISRLYQHRMMVRKKLQELKSSPLEEWVSHRDGVNDAMDKLEKAVADATPQ